MAERLLHRIFTPRHSEKSFGKLLRHELPVLVLLSFATLAMEHLGWLRGFDSYALDSLLLLNKHAASTNVVIVNIDDQDYREVFGGTSPINADRLAEVLAAVAAGKPRVIGVDLDTSARQFAEQDWPDAVWARDAYPLVEDSSAAGPAHVGGGHDHQIVRLPILGGNFKEQDSDEQLSTTPRSGLVLFPQDYDGVVRRYERYFHSGHAEPSSEHSGRVDSLPWAIARQFALEFRKRGGDCPACERIEKTEQKARAEELVLNFAGDQYRFDRIPVRHLLYAAKQDYWSTDSPLRDAIVLVGGTYRAARDEYITPVGPRHGVELIAQAIESELQGGGIRELNWAVAVLMDLAIGVIFLWLSWRFTGRWALYANLAAIVLLSLAASFLAFHAVAFWFNFTAVLVGLWIHLLWDQSQERRKLRAELDECRKAALAH